MKTSIFKEVKYRVLIDEDWWSKVDFLLKFTLLAFELL
jgi:hypothetical protein